MKLLLLIENLLVIAFLFYVCCGIVDVFIGLLVVVVLLGLLGGILGKGLLFGQLVVLLLFFFLQGVVLAMAAFVAN
jgi:hypothetical protein